MPHTNNSSTNGHLNGRSATLSTPTSEPELLTSEALDRRAEPAIAAPDVEPVESISAQDTPSATKAPRKRPVTLLLAGLGIGAIVAGVFGYRWYDYASTHEDTDNASVAGHVYQVSSRISGTVIQVPVADNEAVQEGQLLVQLDPQDYQAKVEQALAALQVAQQQAQAAQSNIALASANSQAQTTQAQAGVSEALSSISNAQAAVAEAQAGVPAAQAQLAEAQATLARTQADFNRYQSLFESGAVSRQQLDSARAAYNVAVAQRNAAQQGVARAQAQLTQAQQGVARAQAQLESSQGGVQEAQASGVQTQVNQSQYEAAIASISQARANLKTAQLQLSYTNITAPAAGRVGRKTVEVGQQVQAGQPMMALVGDDTWVIANFKETQIDHMQPGEAVEVKLDAFPGRTFSGRVDSLSPASGSQFSLLPPDNATGNFTKVVQRIPVKIVLDRDSIRGLENQITPGMSAEVSVDVGRE